MNPKGALPAANLALFNTDTIPPKIGAEADVPSVIVLDQKITIKKMNSFYIPIATTEPDKTTSKL